MFYLGLTTVIREHSKSTFAQNSQVFDPSLRLVHPGLFSSTTPSPHQGTLVLARPSLSPSISILVKFREKKLIMSTSIFG